jgi:hypothetical protein
LINDILDRPVDAIHRPFQEGQRPLRGIRGKHPLMNSTHSQDFFQLSVFYAGWLYGKKLTKASF